MAASWTQLCRARDLVVEDNYVQVVFPSERQHRVAVEEQHTDYALVAVVARQALVSSLAELPLRVWERNRSTSLVGFRIDKRGRLVGEALVPKAGLTADEFQCYLRAVATECDDFEYSLTGRDNE